MKWNGFIGIMVYVVALQRVESTDCSECSDYLVSGPRGISDDKLSASSSYPNGGNLHDPKYSRLHFYKSGNPAAAAWSARTNNDQQYIQAEFSKLMALRAIVTQGRSNSNQWVKSYSVSFSIDGLSWSAVQDVTMNTIIYPANNDRTTIVTNSLPECLEAKYVRINPKTWHGHISLRFDVIGCSKVNKLTTRYKMNWKRYPIILTPEVKKNLTQVFITSIKTMHLCAMKCQQNSLCLSFSLNQKLGTCIGFQEQKYEGETKSFSAAGDEAYFISLHLLEDNEYEVFGNLYYKIFTSKATATTASSICKEENARLLSIHDLDQMNVVTKSISSNLILSQEAHFHVAGSYQNGQWKYDSSTVVPASLWSPSHPVSGNGDCVTLTLDGLKTHNCTDSLFFICGL